ncbi:hypothetical protein PFISCL1PPCAC_13682 [Pristionchus fissidentatus]|uniref:G protein-coupled receptor n=1 Tax=Pristionchus fissidentatus TaxID=1538716 RepID=A0AAV5VSB4_9BILA|nr:hypothetical protein PFISCL1PPCAC_13682 [Pristionchus fissidentatus]
MNFVILPAAIIFIGLGFDGTFGFDASLTAFYVFSLHPVAHSSTLLIVTPAYREKVKLFIQKGCKRVQQVVATENSRLPNMSFYISPVLQQRILYSLHGIFAISTVLNIVALLCLIKFTPPQQATIRNYLLLIQVQLLKTFHGGILLLF